MELDIAAWLGLALRWLHVIAGIAWIGSSFYFIWLDNHLKAVKDGKPSVSGELWAVHGGGFYHNQKYNVAPEDMPEDLHWFKWEAYFTWMSGFLLLALIYYYGANLYLIDKSKIAFTPVEASLAGIGFLLAGWLVYDGLCRSPLGRNNAAFGVVWFLLLTGAAYGLSRIFSGRGAYIHVGAIIGTVMAANVFMVIIPNQKKIVAAMLAGQAPDPRLGQMAKQRSLHNNYMTLPVLFVMISNHYPMTFGNSYGWLALAGLGLSGWFVRHFFNLRHKGRVLYSLMVIAAVIFLAVAMLVTAVQNKSRKDAENARVSYSEVRGIFTKHCLRCHSKTPTHVKFRTAPAGAMFDTEEEIKRYTPRILELAVNSDIMPLGNETGITGEERALLGRWIKENAKESGGGNRGAK